ncbi:MAG: MaoC family dehydratase N-terminal domain-containing protein [Hyphomicrobiales bacterium]|nr:MaoC family dehydratase N-terminal domain-containing protein [Hyphomicrobiales bacterium]MCP5370606.1 MaoC family dehydratase N-terminal domain-containing protein [Hyphomicrobiales bacterium]
MAEIDRSLIGAESEPYVVEVEKGAIRKFAEAIGDPNPAYRDAAAARAQGYPGIIAPPTFPVTFYPPQEQPWTRYLDRRRILAGQQRFSYSRPIVAGDVLTCRVIFRGVEEKQGRSGRMEMILQEIVGEDRDGNHVFTNSKSTVYREAPKDRAE